MALDCKTIRNTRARSICSALGAKAVNIGYIKINYAANGTTPTIRGAYDGKLRAAEVFRAALLAPASAAAARRRNALFKKSTGYAIPWIPNATNRAKIVKRIHAIKSVLKTVGIEPKHKQYRKYLARNIDRWIRLALKIRYRDHKGSEANIDGIIKRGYFRCSEYNTLFYGIARLAGLMVHPVEIHGGAKPHTAIAANVGSGNYLYFDGELGIVKRPVYKRFYLGGVADLFATYLYNLSGIHAKGTPSKIDPITFAGTIAPGNSLVHFGLGSYYHQRKSYRLAMRHYLKAYRLRPSYAKALTMYRLMKIYLSPAE